MKYFVYGTSFSGHNRPVFKRSGKFFIRISRFYNNAFPMNMRNWVLNKKDD